MLQQTEDSGVDLTEMGIVNAALEEVGEADGFRIDTERAHSRRFAINHLPFGFLDISSNSSRA